MYAAADIPQMTKSIRTPILYSFFSASRLSKQGAENFTKIIFSFCLCLRKSSGSNDCNPRRNRRSICPASFLCKKLSQRRRLPQRRRLSEQFPSSPFFYAPFASLTLLRITMSATTTAITAAQMKAVHQKEPIV